MDIVYQKTGSKLEFFKISDVQKNILTQFFSSKITFWICVIVLFVVILWSKSWVEMLVL